MKDHTPSEVNRAPAKLPPGQTLSAPLHHSAETMTIKTPVKKVQIKYAQSQSMMLAREYLHSLLPIISSYHTTQEMLAEASQGPSDAQRTLEQVLT